VKGVIHEQAVLEKFPTAKEFRPVKARRFSDEISGWTFFVPIDSGYIATGSFGWVTTDGEVSSDLMGQRRNAADNVRVYTRTRGDRKVVR
jgi:hypothetical protein